MGRHPQPMADLDTRRAGGEFTRATALVQHLAVARALRPADLRSADWRSGNLRSSCGPRYCYVRGTAHIDLICVPQDMSAKAHRPRIRRFCGWRARMGLGARGPGRVARRPRRRVAVRGGAAQRGDFAPRSTTSWAANGPIPWACRALDGLAGVQGTQRSGVTASVAIPFRCSARSIE